MSKITVSIFLVDGGLQEYEENMDFLHTLRSLQSRGISGKQLVNELISDDWGALPRRVEISGEDAQGSRLDIRIPYS